MSKRVRVFSYGRGATYSRSPDSTRLTFSAVQNPSSRGRCYEFSQQFFQRLSFGRPLRREARRADPIHAAFIDRQLCRSMFLPAIDVVPELSRRSQVKGVCNLTLNRIPQRLQLLRLRLSAAIGTIRLHCPPDFRVSLLPRVRAPSFESSRLASNRDRLNFSAWKLSLEPDFIQRFW